MNRLFLSLIFITLSAIVRGQDLTVRSMTADSYDVSASTYRRLDMNNVPCALVKVRLTVANAQFEGNVIQPVEYKTGEYWVYMTEGSQVLLVKHAQYLPLMIRFSDYGIKRLQSLTTYVVTLVLPSYGNSQNMDDGMRYLAMKVSPANSIIYIDGQQQLESNGQVNVLLSPGQHTYRVEATGYAPENGTVNIGTEKVSKEIKLQPLQSNVSIRCATEKAQIYVNDQLRGNTPWSGFLSSGNYRIEARLTGYRTQQQTLTIGQNDSREINLPSLEPIVGSINVNFTPQDAEVFIDGKRYGTTPDVFRNVAIGNHQLEIRKEGYITFRQTITVNDGKTTELTGSLENQSKQSTSTDNQSKQSISAQNQQTVADSGHSDELTTLDLCRNLGGFFPLYLTHNKKKNNELVNLLKQSHPDYKYDGRLNVYPSEITMKKEGGLATYKGKIVNSVSTRWNNFFFGQKHNNLFEMSFYLDVKFGEKDAIIQSIITDLENLGYQNNGNKITTSDVFAGTNTNPDNVFNKININYYNGSIMIRIFNFKKVKK